MASLRFRMVEEALSHVAVPAQAPAGRSTDYFGELVFGRNVMRRYLDRETYEALIQTMEHGTPLTREGDRLPRHGGGLLRGDPPPHRQARRDHRRPDVDAAQISGTSVHQIGSVIFSQVVRTPRKHFRGVCLRLTVRQPLTAGTNLYLVLVFEPL